MGSFVSFIRIGRFNGATNGIVIILAIMVSPCRLVLVLVPYEVVLVVEPCGVVLGLPRGLVLIVPCEELVFNKVAPMQDVPNKVARFFHLRRDGERPSTPPSKSGRSRRCFEWHETFGSLLMVLDTANIQGMSLI